MKIFLCPSKIRVQLQLVKLGVGHGAQLGDGAVSQGQQLGLVRLQVVAHLGQGLDGGSPVFRRSTRNVPKFWIYPSPTCFIYDLSNADYSWKNCCPFRAFFY